MPKAKNLKYCRLKAGLTQQALSDATGFAKSTINAWETKKRSIPRSRTQELADFFGVSYSDFCDEDFEHLADLTKQGKVTLTTSETQSILMFRALPPEVKKLIRMAIRVAYEESRNKDE